MIKHIDYDPDDLVLWFGLLVLSVVLALSVADPCEGLTKGTDAYWQCTTGEEIDLGVQDEADSRISKGRD